MIRINRQVEYGLMALDIMSKKRGGELTSAMEIVESTGAPFDGTSRVLQKLSQAGFLKSEKGVQGGYVLLKSLGKISFLQFVESILGAQGVAKCLSGTDQCTISERCTIKKPISRLNDKIQGFFENLSLEEILGLEPRQRSPRIRLPERSLERNEVEW